MKLFFVSSVEGHGMGFYPGADEEDAIQVLFEDGRFEDDDRDLFSWKAQAIEDLRTEGLADMLTDFEGWERGNEDLILAMESGIRGTRYYSLAGHPGVFSESRGIWDWQDDLAEAIRVNRSNSSARTVRTKAGAEWEKEWKAKENERMREE